MSVDPTSDPNADSYRYSYSIPYNTSGANVDEAAGGVVVSAFQNNNGLAGANATYIRTDSFVDGLGRVRDTQTVTPQNRVVSQTFYDSRGLAVKQVGPFGSVTTATPDLVTAPAGTKQTVTTFDELARPTGTATTGTDPVSGVVSSLSSTTYYHNLLDSRVLTPAPAGAQQTLNSTKTDWDGNLNSVTEPQTTGPNGAVADRITSYTNDVNGSVVSIVDPKGFTTSFTNDIYGRRTNSSDPDKGNTATYYNVDSVGLSSTTTVDAVGNIVRTSVDTLGRATVTERLNAVGGTSIGQLETYTYKTAAGAGLNLPDTSTSCDPTLAGCGNPITTTIGSYDLRGRPASKTFGIPATYLTSATAGSFTFGYSYNILNERTKVVYPAITDAGLSVSPAETLTSGYDTAGRLKTVQGVQTVSGAIRNYVSDTTYTSEGRLAKRAIAAFSGGLDRTYKYDGLGRVQNLKTTWQNVVVQDDTMAYDSRSSITSMLEGAGPNAGQRQCYSYDEGNRLSKAWTTTAACATTTGNIPVTPNYVNAGLAPYSMAYSYDTDFALKSMTDAVAGTTKTQTFNDVAHKHAVTSSGADTFTYNANGSTATRNVGGVASSLAWTPENRLQSVTTTSTTSYRYDAGGQRIATITPVYTTVYLDGLLEIKSRKRDFGSKGTFTGDVNGDGKADLIEINDNDITVRIKVKGHLLHRSVYVL